MTSFQFTTTHKKWKNKKAIHDLTKQKVYQIKID